MQEQLDRIEKKLDKIIKLLNPIVKIDKELRSDIMKVLSHGKTPRKQLVGDHWKMKDCPACGKPSSEYQYKVFDKCPKCGVKLNTTSSDRGN